MQLLPTDVLVSFYRSIIASFLQYVIVVWGLTYDTYLNLISILQKTVVVAIAFKNLPAPSTTIFLTLRTLKAEGSF